MMMQAIAMPSTTWCLLRTSGPRTLALAASLLAAGIEAWTPRQTFKRPVPGKRPDPNGRRPTMEVDAPILPTFVFARAGHLGELMSLASDPTSDHPAFSVFRHAGRIPLIGDGEVVGLQDEEQRAAELIERQRACETAEERRKVRAAAMKTERARQKALRSERRDFAPRQAVVVDSMPALAGMTGVVESSDGRSAVVSFGGSLIMKIEAWRLAEVDVEGLPLVMSVAA